MIRGLVLLRVETLSMNDTALRAKMQLSGETYRAPADDVLPLRWAIPVWLVLAAASWAAVYGVIRLFL